MVNVEITITKDEILQTLRNKSDFIKLEYLERQLKKNLPAEIRKDVFSIIAEIYTNKSWYNMAAKNYNNAAELSKTFKEKREFYFASVLNFIKARSFLEADDAFTKLLVLSTDKEKQEAKENYVSLFLSEAEKYFKEKNYVNSITFFSRVLEKISLKDARSSEVKKNLVMLYEMIGKPGEATKIRQSM